MRSIDRCRDEYYDYCRLQYRAAEDACGGLVPLDLHAVVRRKHGSYFMALFWGNAATNYCYATEELRHWWEQHPRLTFSEYAWQAGFRWRKFRERSLRAPGARQTAALRAERKSRRRT